MTVIERVQGLAAFATSGLPAWREALLPVGIGLAGLSIVLSLALQVWIPAVQFRRFSRIFANRPDAAVEAFDRVLDLYGWRARLAIKLFKIAIPSGANAARSDTTARSSP